FGYRALTPAQHAPQATFVLLSGERVSTAQLQGKVYMVNFWATSCTTCVKEMPDMVRTYQQFKDKGLEFVAVAMSYDPPMYVTN
ncbi:TlpA family protein disulfide reductase, partial [Acinetobacter baumannii]|nr:TlpA family protein disulfide reductase [Acinetobacter baumannii]